MQYSHPSPIVSFTIAVVDGSPLVITAGGEGTIRMWRFSSGKFELAATLEGHVRGITGVLVVDTYLWSCSLDTTIRVWEIASGRCAGVLSGSDGHSSGVTCMTYIACSPAIPGNTAYIASGDCDGTVILWQPNGQKAWADKHGGERSIVTCLQTFQDMFGGQSDDHELLWFTVVHLTCVCRKPLSASGPQ